MISREAVRAYRCRRFENHDWLKTLPSRDLWAEMRRLKVRPLFKTEPWLHQLVCFYIGLYYPQFLFLLDMGTGKTWIILNILQQLLREKKAQRGLILVPRLINMDSWRVGAEEHSELEPDVVDVKGIEEKWDMLENPRGDFTVIDYTGFHLATMVPGKRKGAGRHSDEKKLAKLRRRYDFIGLDESHKVGNHESLWFAQLRQLTREASFCYAATGTLFSPPNLEPIWSQFYLVDRGLTFGENLGCFRETFFTAEPHPFKGQVLKYNRARTPLLNKMIGHRSLRYEDHEVNDLPRCVRRRVLCAMDGEQQEQYITMLERMINAPEDPKEREAYWYRLRQITSGCLSWEDDTGKHHVVFRENPKLDELERWIDEAGGQKICIAHEYTASGELIVERLKKLKIKYKWLYGKTKDPIACKRRFMEDPSVQVFLMNSAAGGTGVDGLQRVCRYMLLYESPSSPTARSQLIKRIYRAGQLERSYVIDFAVERTVDVGILNAVEEGKDLYDSVMQGRGVRNGLM